MARQISSRFHSVSLIAALAVCMVALNAWLSSPVSAGSAKEIDASVDDGLAQFEKEVKGGKSFLDSSKGVLVFPSVLKGGVALEQSTVRARFESTARRSITTTPQRLPLACKWEDRSRPSLSCFWMPMP